MVFVLVGVAILFFGFPGLSVTVGLLLAGFAVARMIQGKDNHASR